MTYVALFFIGQVFFRVNNKKFLEKNAAHKRRLELEVRAAVSALICWGVNLIGPLFVAAKTVVLQTVFPPFRVQVVRLGVALRPRVAVLVFLGYLRGLVFFTL
jgi:hypothetical protein